MDPVYFILVLLVIFLGFLAITPAFGSTLVRYRANYMPKRIQLEDLDAKVNHAAQGNALGYFGMMKRVSKLEGWTGFYKGFIPTSLGAICSAIFLSFFFVQVTIKPGMSPSILSQVGVANGVVSILFALFVGIPFQIIINRAIVTPYRLPTFGLSTSLRALLTPYERRRPWVLYLTPGFVLAVALQSALQLGFLGISQQFISPILRNPQHPLHVAMIISYWAVALVFVTISVPLQVISTKLSIQRNFGGEDPNSASSGLQVYSSEHVVEIRDEMEPYTGLIDCASKIMREEGWKTMFRAWWITVLPYLFFLY